MNPKTVECPICRTPTAWQGNPFRPFCSERCRTEDLAGWAKESYRIASEEAPSVPSPDDESPSFN